jgi:hypothetical protein
LQIKNAIARLEIKIGGVQLAAMTEAGRKISLRHLGIENLGLEIVKGLRVLRVQRAAQKQCKQSRRETYACHFPSPAKSWKMSIVEKFYTIREQYSQWLPTVDHAREVPFRRPNRPRKPLFLPCSRLMLPARLGGLGTLGGLPCGGLALRWQWRR